MRGKLLIPGIFLCAAFIFFVWKLQPPAIVVSPAGNDANDGRTNPVRTIQHAVELATHGGRIVVKPGIYRETVVISGSNQSEPLVITGDGDALHPVIVRGSEPSFSYRWSPCTSAFCARFPKNSRAHLYETVIPEGEAPTLLTQTLEDGSTAILPLAKSPNGSATHSDGFQKNWWRADSNSVSSGIISDQTHLKTFSDISGSRAVIVDGADRCGTFLYVRTIVGTDPKRGTFSTDFPIGALTYGHQERGASEFSVYMLENNPEFLDEAGEWYFDPNGRTLYLWPLEDKHPDRASIEISRRNTAFRIKRSGVHIQGFSVDRINDYTYSERPVGAYVLDGASHIADISIRNSTVQYAGNGIIGDITEKGSIKNLSLSHMLIQHMSRSAITLLGGQNPKSLLNIDVSNITARDIGFPYTDPAIMVVRGSQASIHNNTVTNTSGYGVHVTAFEKGPGVFDALRIAHNDISHACQNMSGCSALKLFGGRFTNTVITGNSLHDNIGWSSCQENRFGSSGDASGLFISNASGVSVFHNRSYNNAYAAYLVFTRQFPATDNTLVGNTASHSDIGIALVGDEGDVDTDPQANATRHDRTVIRQNRISENRIGILLDPAHPPFVALSGNNYQKNSVALQMNDTAIRESQNIQKMFPYWEISLFEKIFKNIRFQ